MTIILLTLFEIPPKTHSLVNEKNCALDNFIMFYVVSVVAKVLFLLTRHMCYNKTHPLSRGKSLLELWGTPFLPD